MLVLPYIHGMTCTDSVNASLLKVVQLLQACAEEMGELRDYVESLGGQLMDGWSLTMKLGPTRTLAGHYDREFRAPTGSTYRSKVTAQFSLTVKCLRRMHMVPLRRRSAACRESLLHLPGIVDVVGTAHTSASRSNH